MAPNGRVKLRSSKGSATTPVVDSANHFVTSVVLGGSVIVCAIEYIRWDLGGLLFGFFVLLATVAALFPGQLRPFLVPQVKQETHISISQEQSPSLIICELTKSPTNDRITSDGLKALLHLSDPAKSSSKACAELIEAGVLPLLFSIMTSNTSSHATLLRAMSVLKNIVMQENTPFFLDKSGGRAVETIIKIMKVTLKQDQEAPHESTSKLVAEVQRLGSLIVGSICDGRNELKTAAVDEGFLVVILESMDWFRFHEKLNEWALWSILNITFCHSSNKV
jgi:hypothetical protein